LLLVAHLDQALAFVKRHVRQSAYRDRKRRVFRSIRRGDDDVGQADEFLFDRSRFVLFGFHWNLLLSSVRCALRRFGRFLRRFLVSDRFVGKQRHLGRLPFFSLESHALHRQSLGGFLLRRCLIGGIVTEQIGLHRWSCCSLVCLDLRRKVNLPFDSFLCHDD